MNKNAITLALFVLISSFSFGQKDNFNWKGKYQVIQEWKVGNPETLRKETWELNINEFINRDTIFRYNFSMLGEYVNVIISGTSLTNDSCFYGYFGKLEQGYFPPSNTIKTNKPFLKLIRRNNRFYLSFLQLENDRHGNKRDERSFFQEMELNKLN